MLAFGDTIRVLNSMPPYNLFGVDDPGYENAKVVVLPVPYDSATTYKPGARDGPHAIIDASRSIELYSEELENDATGIGIHTLEELSPDLNSPEDMAKSVEKEVSLILDDSKVPLLLGGDHSIAIGSIRAIGKRHKDFTALQFDAHTDNYDTLMGSKYCHACVMARAREVTGSCYSVGVRSVDERSANKIDREILYRKDMHRMATKEIVDNILKHCKKNVYLTVDLDVLDPSEMPSTGTPEPDGLRFYELTQILKGVLAKRNLIGADFTELSPIAGMVAPNFLAAKLIYLTLGYAFLK